MKIGIIGGSGLYEIPSLEFVKEVPVGTEYGEPSDAYLHYRYNNASYYFLSRHGRAHNKAPHKINYRANIDGFRKLGISHILSFSATGGIAEGLKPCDIVVPDNAIDFTNGRISTFYDKDEIVHIDFTDPFCPRLREMAMDIMISADIPHRDGGVSICTNGPRLESAAEIKAFRNWGADIVGMTLFPECVLAREKGICYANISVITNYAAGMKPQPLNTSEVIETMARSSDIFKTIITGFAEKTLDSNCKCSQSLNDTKMRKGE